ncbi:Tyrosine recombinase XerC [Sphingobacterium spiritivorum]|nr:Tyrosine recombinase XerC [Sphingobacterium spiritivorum]
MSFFIAFLFSNFPLIKKEDMYQQRFLNFLRFEKRYSNHTIEAYTHELTIFFTFLQDQGIPEEEADHRVIRFYLSHLMEEGRQATSVNRSISALRTYYKFLQRESLTDQNPLTLIKALKTPKKLPSVMEKDKMVGLLDQMEGAVDSFTDERDYLVLELLFGTGIRLTELLQIKITDIDFYNKNILILGKRNKERLVPVNHTLLEKLKIYIQQLDNQKIDNKTAFLIVTKEGKQAYPKMIYRIVHRYLSLISTQRKKSPHVLRHTFATALLDNGADLNAIKELLGHAGLAATQVYTHNSVERLKSVYKQAHPKA